MEHVICDRQPAARRVCGLETRLGLWYYILEIED